MSQNVSHGPNFASPYFCGIASAHGQNLSSRHRSPCLLYETSPDFLIFCYTPVVMGRGRLLKKSALLKRSKRLNPILHQRNRSCNQDLPASPIMNLRSGEKQTSSDQDIKLRPSTGVLEIVLDFLFGNLYPLYAIQGATVCDETYVVRTDQVLISHPGILRKAVQSRTAWEH